jgi:hypothetical protein
VNRAALGLLAGVVALFVTGEARGDGPSPPSSAGHAAHPEGGGAVVVWPTLTPAGDAPEGVALHAPSAVAEKKLADAAQELDATLRDGVEDLGFTLFVADAGPTAGHMRDADLIERASRSGGGGDSKAGTWVVSPRLELGGADGFVVRIVVVPPNSHELRVRVETAAAESVPSRGLVMMRDMLSPAAADVAATEREREQLNRQPVGYGIMGPLRSEGRAILALNSGLFGGFVGYSVQQASGSSDPRLLYPLLAIGAGVGIGAALLVADEWDVTTGDAWFLTAGGFWGSAAGLFIADGRHITPLTDRFAWGVVGGFGGVAVSAIALARFKMDEGDAAMAGSGGALGLGFGGLVDLVYRGRYTNVTPYSGFGYGSAIGLIGASALATQVTISPSRMLLLDAGAGAGALVGAAAASPLVFQNLTDTKSRIWLSSTIVGGVAGGALAWVFTRGSSAPKGDAWRYGSPNAGVIGASATPTGSAPAYGVSWGGPF